jgi:zinc-dependent metalloproteinase lipoprotein
MKKKLFLWSTGIALSFCTHLSAQQDPVTKEFYGTCGTKSPSVESEQAFQKQIASFKAARATGVMVSYEIPVIVHILYKQGLAVGTTANIAAAQVKAQIDALNDCMAGKAPGNSNLPTPFANVDANDIPIHFCLATKGLDGKTLPEAGIDRINFTAKSWTDPATLTDIPTYFDNTIKPNSIWDPKKYFNIWVGDFFDPAKGGLLGYATFPAGTGLSGLTSSIETPSTSGVVMATRVFGCKAKYANGYYASESYIYGITTAHEVGHYLGLRHIGGDNPCSTDGGDFCDDTPLQKGGYQSGPSGQNWGCPSYPFQANACGSGTSPNGEMFQNFMDYTTDACRSLFTADQETRMLTTMQNGTYRKAFGTHGLCSQGPSAVFNADKTSICAGATVAFTDKSGSTPTTWKWTFTGGTPATSTQQNPTVTYNTAGTYDVKLVVTNSLGADSIVQAKYITVNAASPAPTVKDDKRCGPGVVNLTATGSGTLEWYDAATGGTKVNTGAAYSPNLNTTTTYYVGQAGTGTVQKVGPADKSIGAGSYFTLNNDRATYFDVLQPITLKTVKVDANTAGDRTIEVFDASNTSIAKKTVTLVAGLNTAALDIALNTGNGYYIKLADGSTNDLYRNTAGAAFPYTLSGIISITGTDAANNGGTVNYYYYFYDWEISTASCPGLRAAVTGTINPNPTKPTISTTNGVDLTASPATSYQWYLNGTPIPGATAQTYTIKEKGTYTLIITDANGCTSTSDAFIATGISTLENEAYIDIFPNPTTGNFTLNLTVTQKDDYQISLKNVLGQVICNENLNNFKGTYNKQFDLSVYGKGVYTLTLIDTAGQQIKKIIVQ